MVSPSKDLLRRDGAAVATVEAVLIGGRHSWASIVIAHDQSPSRSPEPMTYAEARRDAMVRARAEWQ
jgi:hypothetical protein